MGTRSPPGSHPARGATLARRRNAPSPGGRGTRLAAPRTIVVGDVHGCRAELERLLERCGRTDDDRVILVGDLVAKGPDSRGVVRVARALGARAVMGNHDWRIVEWFRARGEKPKLREQHQQVVDTLDNEDFRYLDALPYTIELEELEAIVVHAGLVPGVAIADQNARHLITMRTLRADGRASPSLNDGKPWATRWPGPRHVYFGHDAISGLQQHAHATGLDTGCVYGRQLTACVLPERHLVSVDAERTYSPVRP